MAKTYTVPCSTKTAYRNTSTAYTQYPYSTSNYYAGKYSTYVCGVNCLFSGLSGINASAVTGITVHVQRVTGGANITYAVNLNYSVLVSDASSALETGSTQFTTNKKEWQWAYNESATGGEYNDISLGTSLFSNLRDYGFAVAGTPSRPDNVRSINIGDVYLTVTTSEIDYVLSYDLQGGEGSLDSQTAAGTTSASFTISSTVPTRDGYSFEGWATSAGGAVSYQPSETITVTCDVTLYAVWSAQTCTVTFDANGGTVSPTTMTVTYGQAYGTLPTPTRTTGTFSGWYYGDTLITSTSIVSTLENHTLVADWGMTSPFYMKMTDGSMKPAFVFRKTESGMSQCTVYTIDEDGALTN